MIKEKLQNLLEKVLDFYSDCSYSHNHIHLYRFISDDDSHEYSECRCGARRIKHPELGNIERAYPLSIASVAIKDKTKEFIDVYKKSKIDRLSNGKYVYVYGDLVLSNETDQNIICVRSKKDMRIVLAPSIVFDTQLNQNHPELIKARKQLKFLNKL